MFALPQSSNVGPKRHQHLSLDRDLPGPPLLGFVEPNGPPDQVDSLQRDRTNVLAPDPRGEREFQERPLLQAIDWAQEGIYLQWSQRERSCVECGAPGRPVPLCVRWRRIGAPGGSGNRPGGCSRATVGRSRNGQSFRPPVPGHGRGRDRKGGMVPQLQGEHDLSRIGSRNSHVQVCEVPASLRPNPIPRLVRGRPQ